MAMAATKVNGHHDVSESFEWNTEYDAILENIASTDTFETEWTKLKDVLKYKLNQNIAEFLKDAKNDPPSAPSPTESNPSTETNTTGGGLRLPPFSKREDAPGPRNEYNSYAFPKSKLTQEEANEMKQSIYAQLDEFEGNPPFTIQRVCDLLSKPRQHYKTLGKYLRAFEKSLLVTSTWDAFPIIPGEASQNEPVLTSTSTLTEATTPIFSPIPFLHGDARSRSRSRSPPPSPLELAAKRQLSPGPHDPSIAALAVEPSSALVVPDAGDGPVIGLVDELDDPGPGHMSDHPTALTAVTTAGSGSVATTLEERFTKATVPEDTMEDIKADDKPAGITNTDDTSKGQDVEDMVVDEPDADKENTK